MSTVITFSLPNIEDVISVSFIIKLIRKTALKRMSEHVISQSERVRERLYVNVCWNISRKCCFWTYSFSFAE